MSRWNKHCPIISSAAGKTILRHTTACIILALISLQLTSCSMLSLFRIGREDYLREYEGKWYVIARMPNRYEEGLICTTSTYTFSDDGTLSVTNAGRERSSGRITSLTSRVWIPDKRRPDIFRVQLFFTITRDYRLVYMAEDRSCAIIGSPSMNLMWILCRDPLPGDEKIMELTQTAKDSGYDTERLIMVEQSCGE